MKELQLITLLMEFLKSCVPSLLSLYCIIQMLNTQVTMSQQHVQLETAYNSLKITYIDESASFVSASNNMSKILGYNQQSGTTNKDTVFTWTIYSKISAIIAAPVVTDSKDTTETKRKYWRRCFFGEEAI